MNSNEYKPDSLDSSLDSSLDQLELQKKAIAKMIEGINIAQQKGAYSLEESYNLFEAISLFLKKEDIK